jgi:hypothetical protein
MTTLMIYSCDGPGDISIPEYNVLILINNSWMTIDKSYEDQRRYSIISRYDDELITSP